MTDWFALAEEIENSPDMSHMDIATKIRDSAIVVRMTDDEDAEVVPLESLKEITRRLEVCESRLKEAGWM